MHWSGVESTIQEFELVVYNIRYEGVYVLTPGAPGGASGTFGTMRDEGIGISRRRRSNERERRIQTTQLRLRIHHEERGVSKDSE